MANNGRWLYAKVEAFAEELLKNLEGHFPNSLISLSGDYRRRMEIIDQLDVLIGVSEAQLRSHPIGEQVDEKLQFKTEEGIYLNIIRIEQTPEEQKVSEQMEKFYNNYRDTYIKKDE